MTTKEEWAEKKALEYPAPPPRRTQFDLFAFSAVNRLRCEDGFKHKLKSWSPLEWAGAMCGEAGEAANYAKKLLRIRDGLTGNKETDMSQDDLRRKVMNECADTIIYADLLIQSIGGITAEVVAEVFNAKSDQIGCAIKF